MTKKIRGMAVIVVVLVLSLSTVLAGCNGGNKSKAVTREELIRPNYSKEMEAKHDAEGREHIAIPEGAQTVTVEGIEYTVLTTLADMHDMNGNYILANNVEWGQKGENDKPYTGKFHGNNYKIYGFKGTSTLFKYTKNAVIQNIIISSNSKGEYTRENSILSSRAIDTVFKNIINYYQPIPENNVKPLMPMINWAWRCEITGLKNYADLYSYGGGIVYELDETKISNCANYGNISGDSEWGNGGIVGRFRGESIIENCENYGIISGTCALGGIMGKIEQEDGGWLRIIVDLSRVEDFLDTQIVRNCKNYGDIVLSKNKYDKRREKVDHKWHDNIYCIGGIAGNASIIENCVNEGNFYGFESLGKKLYVDYLGGIAGAAKKVTNSVNKGTYNIHKGRAKNVGDLVGYTIV